MSGNLFNTPRTPGESSRGVMTITLKWQPQNKRVCSPVILLRLFLDYYLREKYEPPTSPLIRPDMGYIVTLPFFYKDGFSIKFMNIH